MAAPPAPAQGLDALRAASGRAVQLYGGIGFTGERHAHLYVKRAASDALLFGPVHALRAHAAERAGLFATAATTTTTATTTTATATRGRAAA